MILDCIASALSQDYDNFEVVVSDNCSTDGTWELCYRSYSHHSKIRLIRNSSNIGPVMNWLVAAQAATGYYTKFLFSDDLLFKSCLSSLISQFDKDVGFSYSSCLIGESCELSKLAYSKRSIPGYCSTRVPSSDGLISYAMLAGLRMPVSPGAALFRTSDVISSLSRSMDNPSSPESVITGAGPDVQIFLDALISYPYYIHSNEPLSFFRAHAGSFTLGEERLSVRKGYESTFKRFFQGVFWGYSLLYGFSRICRVQFRFWRFVFTS